VRATRRKDDQRFAQGPTGVGAWLAPLVIYWSAVRMGAAYDRCMSQRGFGLLEIVLVVAVVAVAGYLLMQYVMSSAKAVEQMQQERPIDRSRLAADRATLASIESVVRTYHAEKGEWPPDRGAVLTLLVAPPKFQCAGNDFEYEPASGTLRLTVSDDARCMAAP
jgi:prepilin-type N-terminal cleavage/methylation domain-containing protein